MAEIIIRNMPRELRQELKIQAAKEGRSMTAIIIGLIIAYLQEKRKEGWTSQGLHVHTYNLP